MVTTERAEVTAWPDGVPEDLAALSHHQAAEFRPKEETAQQTRRYKE